MQLRNRAEPQRFFLILEAVLPLFLLTGISLLYAAVLIPVFTGVTLLVFEMLRRRPRAALSAFFLFWLAICGGLGWFYLAVPPYWIWSVYLLVPETAWAPSDAQQAKPYLFGLKKYFKRRILELIMMLVLFLVCASGAYLLRQRFQSAAYWAATIFMLLIFEIIFGVVWGRKK